MRLAESKSEISTGTGNWILWRRIRLDRVSIFGIGNGDGTFQAVQSFGTDLGPQFTFAVGNFAAGGGLAVAAAGASNDMVFFQTAVVVSPAVVNFGSLAIGSTSDPMTVTVTNSTPAIVNISGITVSEAGSSVDFHQTSTTCGENAGRRRASCTVQVTFQPTVAGPLSALRWKWPTTRPGSPQSATLSGSGTAAPVATFSTTSVTFAAQGVGNAKSCRANGHVDEHAPRLSSTLKGFPSRVQTQATSRRQMIASLRWRSTQFG